MAGQASLREAGDELDRLTDYVRQIADLVGQRDLTIEVVVRPLPDGVRAACTCITGRRYARVTVATGFFALSPDEQREAIVHEMVHPHLHALAEHVEGLQGEIGRAHHVALLAGFMRDLERASDALTGALVEHMPLPSWGRRA